MADGSTGGRPRFRVSDAVAVPLRGMLLRLRVVEGQPRIGDFEPGSTLRLIAPGGTEREARVKDFAATAGRQTQERLDRYGELDVVIATEDALKDEEPVEIGWHVTSA